MAVYLEKFDNVKMNIDEVGKCIEKSYYLRSLYATETSRSWLKVNRQAVTLYCVKNITESLQA